MFYKKRFRKLENKLENQQELIDLIHKETYALKNKPRFLKGDKVYFFNGDDQTDGEYINSYVRKIDGYHTRYAIYYVHNVLVDGELREICDDHLYLKNKV